MKILKRLLSIPFFILLWCLMPIEILFFTIRWIVCGKGFPMAPAAVMFLTGQLNKNKYLIVKYNIMWTFLSGLITGIIITISLFIWIAKPVEDKIKKVRFLVKRIDNVST